jgi:hypothetical protein
MSILDDIKYLKEHYKNRLNWYFAAAERVEGDIQLLWNEYFISKSNTLKLMELDRTFSIYCKALEYFRSNASIIEKRLDQLEKEEYAIINKGSEPIS